LVPDDAPSLELGAEKEGGVMAKQGERTDLKDLEREDGWITAQEAGDKFKCTARVFSRAAESGTLERKRSADDKVWLYRESDCAELREPDVREEMLSSVRDMLKVANQHAKDAFDLVTSPSRELFKLLREENTALREEKGRLTARIEHLEKTHDTLVLAREAALNEQHARELEQKKFDRKEARLDAMMTSLSSVAPELLAQLMQTISDKRDPRGAAAVRLVELMAEQRERGSKDWTPEMLELLRQALGAEQQEEAKAAE
jgi:hypothetical protein